MTSTSPVIVKIPHAKFWSLAQHHNVHMNVSVFKTLREAGVPVEGGLELRGVTHGRLECWNEIEGGHRVCCYRWTPGPLVIDLEDEEL